LDFGFASSLVLRISDFERAMPANVRSIPALADFRAALLTFGESARRALDEVRMEMQRGLTWIADEQPVYWKAEHQRSFDLVAERRSELESCQNRTMDGERATCYQERKALEAAKARLPRCTTCWRLSCRGPWRCSIG
jgi:hypothetical protein